MGKKSRKRPGRVTRPEEETDRYRRNSATPVRHGGKEQSILDVLNEMKVALLLRKKGADREYRNQKGKHSGSRELSGRQFSWSYMVTGGSGSYTPGECRKWESRYMGGIYRFCRSNPASESGQYPVKTVPAKAPGSDSFL